MDRRASSAAAAGSAGLGRGPGGGGLSREGRMGSGDAGREAGEAEGEAGAAGAATSSSCWLLPWVSRGCFGVRAVAGGEWEKPPPLHFPLRKREH